MVRRRTANARNAAVAAKITDAAAARLEHEATLRGVSKSTMTAELIEAGLRLLDHPPLTPESIRAMLHEELAKLAALDQRMIAIHGVLGGLIANVEKIAGDTVNAAGVAQAQNTVLIAIANHLGVTFGPAEGGEG